MADEKSEKDMEKRDEKSPQQEKNWDEKWRRDPVFVVAWACIFIWAGIVFLVDALGYIESWTAGLDTDVNAWSFIFMGAGVIVLLGVLFRLFVPEYQRPVTGNIILGLILIGIGLGDLFNWAVVWALILILIGISIIFRGVRQGKKTDSDSEL
jgi:hypothetical protein